MTAPNMSLDDIDWDAGNSTLFYYEPRFRFPLEELVALARAHARCPGLVHRKLRRDMDPDAVARLFALEGLGGLSNNNGGPTISTAANDEREEDHGVAGLDDEPGYVTVEEPAAEELAGEYVVVGTAEEVERERRREADAEAEFEAGFSDRVRAIEELLEDEEEDAATAERRKLIDNIDRFVEEEAARDAGWNTVYRTIEQHFAFTNDEEALGTTHRSISTLLQYGVVAPTGGDGGGSLPPWAANSR